MVWKATDRPSPLMAGAKVVESAAIVPVGSTQPGRGPTLARAPCEAAVRGTPAAVEHVTELAPGRGVGVPATRSPYLSVRFTTPPSRPLSRCPGRRQHHDPVLMRSPPRRQDAEQRPCHSTARTPGQSQLPAGGRTAKRGAQTANSGRSNRHAIEGRTPRVTENSGPLCNRYAVGLTRSRATRGAAADGLRPIAPEGPDSPLPRERRESSGNPKVADAGCRWHGLPAHAHDRRGGEGR